MRAPRDATHVQDRITPAFFKRADSAWFVYREGEWTNAPDNLSVAAMQYIGLEEVSDVELLRTARAFLAEGDGQAGRGICNAIVQARYVHGNSPRVRFQTDSLKLWVDSMLGNSVWLWTWLKRKGYVADGVQPSDIDRKKLRQTRLNWLDWMIEYCEKEENGQQNN